MTLPERPTAAEREFFEEQRRWQAEESAYTAIQGTKPQTLAYALTDSPVGLAGWIVEKMQSWTDNDGSLESAIDRDRVLANISLYWFTGAINSSFWPYYAIRHGDAPLAGNRTVDVPMGYASHPGEIRHPPRSLAERSFTNIQHWSQMERGGHFAALEQPAALAEDITAFFRKLAL